MRSLYYLIRALYILATENATVCGVLCVVCVECGVRGVWCVYVCGVCMYQPISTEQEKLVCSLYITYTHGGFVYEISPLEAIVGAEHECDSPILLSR